jgi:cytochrome P450
VTTLFRLTHPTASAAFEGVPGPEPSLPLGNAGDFLGKWPWEVCAGYGRTYGGMCVAWLGGTPAVVLNDPDLIGAVLDSDADAYYKDAPHDAVAPVIGEDDLFIANGEKWAAQRRTSPLVRPFVKDWLAAQLPNLRLAILDWVDQNTGETIDDLIEPLRRVVYEALSVAIWGRKLGDENYNEFLKMARVGSGRLTELPVLTKLPPLDPVFYLDRKRWTETFRDLVTTARNNPNDGHPNTLLRLTLQAGPQMTDDELAHALSAPVYFGGVFSAASGIAHTLRFLAGDAPALAAVLKELEGRGPLTTGFTAAALAGCDQLDHAVCESMRLSPPVALWFRSVRKDQPAVLGGRKLPPDTPVFITNWLLHRDPGHWAHADRFRPDRWADGGADRDPYGSGYFFPFGRGPRACVGQEVALYVMKLVLAVLLSRVKVQLDLTHEAKSDFYFAVQHPKKQKARFEPV